MHDKGNISPQTHQMYYNKTTNDYVGMPKVFLQRKPWKAKNAFKNALRIHLKNIWGHATNPLIIKPNLALITFRGASPTL